MSNGNETAKGMGRRRGPMGGRGMAPGEKPKDLKGAIGKLASYIRHFKFAIVIVCLLYTSPSPRDSTSSRMPSSA